MKYIEDIVSQTCKRDMPVCGDVYGCHRSLENTIFVLCDGIGSGVYANIAAITCLNRILELARSGMSAQAICRMVADSMHEARKGEFPFAAFTVATVYPDGQFTVYTYEAPDPILLMNGTATPLKPDFHRAKFEQIGESSGILDEGDSLILFSDGASQAGAGIGFVYGIGTEGLADAVNRMLEMDPDFRKIPKALDNISKQLCRGVCVDDTTVAALHCKQAKELTILTGPPVSKTRDREFVESFIESKRPRVVCGSTTADIVARETGKKVTVKSIGGSFGSPPEYEIEGLDMVSEGAILLNQVYNILGEEIEEFVEDTVVHRLCLMMYEADVITFLIGNAANNAHTSLSFKQVGVKPRHISIKLIAEKLREMGKLVILRDY